MIQIRKSHERGHFNFGWLDTYHTFSFGDYYDPHFMGFRSLRVINEDRVHPGKGFPTHGHRDMEIVTYILQGSLEHKDSLGNGSIIRPGDVQRMSAGTGVLHSEFNPSETEPVHLLQIWILPEKSDMSPGYEQKNFSDEKRQDKLCLVASSTGEADSVTIRQDAKIFVSKLGQGKTLNYDLQATRAAWLQVAKGRLQINGQLLEESDGVAITGENRLNLQAETSSEFLLFDLA